MHRLRWSGRHAWALFKRIAIAIIGGLVIVAGIVLCVTPGPGLLILMIGLSILATEFGWARKARTSVHRKIRALKRRWEMEMIHRRTSQRQLR